MSYFSSIDMHALVNAANDPLDDLKTNIYECMTDEYSKKQKKDLKKYFKKIDKLDPKFDFLSFRMAGCPENKQSNGSVLILIIPFKTLKYVIEKNYLKQESYLPILGILIEYYYEEFYTGLNQKINFIVDKIFESEQQEKLKSLKIEPKAFFKGMGVDGKVDQIVDQIVNNEDMDMDENTKNDWLKLKKRKMTFTLFLRSVYAKDEEEEDKGFDYRTKMLEKLVDVFGQKEVDRISKKIQPK